MKCPHCHKAIVRLARQGGLRFDLITVIVDPDTLEVSGPCARCRRMVTIIREGALTPEFSIEKTGGQSSAAPRPRRVVRVVSAEGPAPHTG